MTKLKRSLLPLILFFVSLSLMLVGCTGHKISEKWSGDLTQHWHECDRENCVLKHNSGNHEGGTATCMKLAICSVCEKEYGEVDTTNHTYWDEGEKTVAHDGCYILYSCKCGATRKELTPELINEAYSILLNTKEKMTNTDKLSFNVKEFNNNEFSYGFDNENKLYYFELDDGNGYYSYDKVVLESDKYYLYEKSTLSAFESTEVDENYVKNMQTLIFNNIFNSIHKC